MQTKSKHAFLLDTHVWFRHHSSPAMLSENVTATIDEAVSRRSAYVSAISVWELALQERKGRLQLEGGALQWTHDSLARLGLSLLPLSPEVLIESVYLAKPMHKDPADRILVATAAVEKLTLITADKEILTFAKATGLETLQAS